MELQSVGQWERRSIASPTRNIGAWGTRAKPKNERFFAALRMTATSLREAASGLLGMTTLEAKE
jgi:hypothetical protein